MTEFYGADLAWIHHVGFGELVDEGGRALLQRLADEGIRDGRLVDLGCGSGTFAREAARAGFAVLGVDLSPAMIELARQTAPEAEFRCGSLFDVELPPSRVVTVLGEGLNYCAAGEPDDRRLDALFARIAAALEPGGALAFDVIVADPRRPLDGSFARTGEDWAVIAELKEDLPAGRLTRAITIFRRHDAGWRRSRETHEVRVFDTEALLDRLRAHGFAVETATSYGDAPLKPRRRAFLARRAAD